MFFRLIRHWIWRDPQRCAHKLLSFAETEADGGRDLARAAEQTTDPILRRLYLRHAADEQRHAKLFRVHGEALLRTSSSAPVFLANTLAPGERGLDDLSVDEEPAADLLAFLHLSEKAAARRFQQYRAAVARDAGTQALFGVILEDEDFHMRYTATQLKRIAPRQHGWILWRARCGRLWKAYLRVAVRIANLIASVVLTIEYFILVPPFAFLARRAAAREHAGWSPMPERTASNLTREY